MLTSRRRRQHLRLLALPITLALLVGWVAVPAAQAEGSKLKAITAFDSKPSLLRRGPDGKPLTQKQRDALAKANADRELGVGAASALGSSDQMGAPADKTVLRSDQVLKEANASGVAAGNATYINQYALKGDMSGVDGDEPSLASTTQRATIDHRYPSVHGHFMVATQESVLQFKSGLAGADTIFTLATTDAAAQKWTYDSGLDAIDAVSGGTYVIKTGGNTAVTNVGVDESSAFGTPPQLATLADNNATPAYNQQWAIVPRGNNYYQLISRADGLCIAHPGSDSLPPVSSASCEGADPSTLWRAYANGQLWSFHVGDVNGPGLVSTGNDLALASPAQAWEIHKVSEPGGSVPTWSTVRTKGNTAGQLAAPYAMAAGDLDGVATSDAVETSPAYHDEAVVAYTDSNNNWALRVIDYNAGNGHLLVTAPDPTIQFGQTGDVENGIRNPGDLIVEIGDFDGDGRNEIATAHQDSGGNFRFTFWRYNANSDGTRALKLLSKCLGCGAAPFTATDNIAKQQGYASSAVGDFDGDGRDDIALAYVNNVATTTANSGRKANLGVLTLNADLSVRSSAIITPGVGDDTLDLPPSMAGDAGRASSGLELVAGNLVSDPESGFGPQRSELALAWAADHVGDHVYNPNTTKDEHPYTIQPVLNIYSAATSDCNNTGTTCDVEISPTNGQAAPTPLFPTNPSQTAYRDFGTGYSPPPISLAVGAFGGNDPSDPPVDGLLASAWLEWNQRPDEGGTGTAYYTQQSIVIPWVSGDDTHTKWNITDTQQQVNNSDWQLIRYTGYDAAGASLVLGAPSIIDLQQNVKENVVAAEPPTHVDWLNGQWSNVSATSAFYLQTSTSSTKSFTSQTSNENSWNTGVHEGFDEKVTFTEPIGPIQEKSYIDVNQKFEKNWSGLSQTSTNASSSWSMTASAQTNEDDMFSYSADDTRLYRYPVVGKAGQVSGNSDCTSGCRAYYDVYVPKGSVVFNNVPGKSTSLFQPAWQNMNALSYPVIDSNAADPVPMPDLGSYSYTDGNGKLQTVTKPMYNQVNTVSGNTSTVALDFSQAAGSGTTTSHSRSFKVGADVTVSGKVEFDTPLGDGSFKTTLSSGFDVTKTTASTVTGNTDTSSAQSFSLNVPDGLDSGQGYRIGTAYYFSQDGAAKVVHGVDLTSDVQGRAWWQNAYGEKPDPALNLPNRIELAFDNETKDDDLPLWLVAPQRQLIRGFQVLQGADDQSGLPTAGVAYTVNPTAGEKVVFQVPVSNYSLTNMPSSITATWYAVPVISNDLQVNGLPVKFGTSTVPAIVAQGTEQVQSPTWTAPTSPFGVTQQYRIFVRLDEAGTAPDLHPLSGDACPVDSLEATGNDPTPELYDTMSLVQEPDPLGCGQNNQGYGLVTVDVGGDTASAAGKKRATPAEPARAKLAGGGLVDGNADHLRLTEDSAVPTITFGDRITGLVHASAKTATGDHPLIAVYDGPVSDGKLIAVTRMPGIDDQKGGTATFTWRPDRAGLHELHHVLLGTSSTGEDDEQVMRVNVAEPVEGFTVTAASSTAAVRPGDTFTISGKATPVPSQAVFRAVQLQRKTDKGWQSVDNQQTSGTGAFSFEVTEPDEGDPTFRVLKVHAPGRPAVVSDEVHVTVRNGVVVTAEADPVTVRAGQRVTFTGTALPTQPRTADRGVELQQKYAGTWRTVATARTDANGSYLISTEPTTPGRLQYRVTKTAVGNQPPASSPAVEVTVTRHQFTVSAKLSAATIRLGRSATITGNVTPTLAKAADRTIRLQVRIKHGWRTVRIAHTRASGSYELRVRPGSTGGYSFRVVKSAAKGISTGVSKTLKLTVRR